MRAAREEAHWWLRFFRLACFGGAEIAHTTVCDVATERIEERDAEAYAAGASIPVACVASCCASRTPADPQTASNDRAKGESDG